MKARQDKQAQNQAWEEFDHLNYDTRNGLIKIV